MQPHTTKVYLIDYCGQSFWYGFPLCLEGWKHMATSVDFKDYMEDQCRGLGDVRFKTMFGEYGLFYREKMVGVLADNKLYIKPTDEGKTLVKDVVMEKFYEQGNPYFLIEDTDDRDLLWKLIIKTYEVLPARVEKKRKMR